MPELHNIVRRPLIVTADTPLAEVLRLMVQHRVGAVVVADREGNAEGIFTERDNLVRVTARRVDTRRTAISEVMSRDVKTIAAFQDTDDAIQVMLANHYMHLPVTNSDGVVVGIVSLRYLLMLRMWEQHHSLERSPSFVDARRGA